MLNMKRSKWSLGVLLLVALGLLIGLASMATAKNPGDATGTPALKSKRSNAAQTSALTPTGTARAELAVPVPNDECTKAPLVADISAAVNATTFHQGNHVAIWLPHPLDNLGTQIEPGLTNVRPQDVYQAALNFSTDKPVCDYDEITPWPGWHERSVWYHYVPEKAGILYLTSYDPMYTRGGEFTTTGAIFRTDYDTVMTVFSTQGGNWCDTWTTMDWAPGVHNGQYDDAYYLNSGFVPPSTFPPGSAFTTPAPENGASFPYTLAGYGSLRERGTNDYFHPGNHFMGSVDCVNFGFNTDQTASAVEVTPGNHYYILVQHYWYPKVVGYCPTDLVLDATFIPHVPTTTWAGPADATARQTMVEDEKIVDARRVALSLASNGRIWDDIVNFDWLANYHPTGVAGAGLLQWAEFAYDPFNAAYFFYDDMQYTADGDVGTRTAGNRRADAYWVNKNFFNPSAAWDPTSTPPSGTDRTDDFTAFGFASRSAISQMRNYAAEAQFIAQGATWTNTAGTGAQPMNRWFLDTRAVDGEGPLAGQIDSLDLMPDASGYAYSVNDIDNDFDFVYEWLTVPEGNAAQNIPSPTSCGNLLTWPPTNVDYNFLSRTGGSVSTVAVKAPVTTWLVDRGGAWDRTLDATANLGGSVLSGEVAVHIVNDTIEPLSGAADLGASIVYTYDEDTVCAPDNNGMNNPGDTGPTYSMRAYAAAVMGVPPFKILAATVGLDDTVDVYNCANGTWDVETDGLLVPDTTVTNTIDHIGQVDPLVRHSAVIYFIDQSGNLWAVRDEVWNLQAGDPIPNGMPDPTQAANYHQLIAAGAGVGYDLRNAEYMTYNATTGELLISLHGTGGHFGTPSQSWESSSKIISYNDRNTPAGYRGVLVHDPEVLINQIPDILAANHQNVGGPAVHNYLFNFDNTTGFGTNGSLETYPDNFPTNINRYPIAPSMPYQPTWNAGLTVGPTDFLGTAVGDSNWGDPYENTAHIFAVAGREDYIQEAISELDPVQKGGADPNFWMTAIMDFRANPANLSGGDFAWYDAAYSNLNSWAQDLPYTSRCDGFYHGMTGLSYFHDNSRPDVWFTSTGVIPMTPPVTTCFSDRTCEAMHSYCWLTDIALEWRSWDFAGTGVVGYDGYLMVYTNPLGVGGVYNPDNWTARSIFLDTKWHPEYTALPEVAGPDRAHSGKLFDTQRYTYSLPCDLTGEAFIRIVAYDKEGNTSFTETKPFRIGVQSVIAMNDTLLGGEVVHRLQPEQKHRIIPVEWTYDPDPCIVGGVHNNAADNECGKLEFDITFDGGYSWQCMHVLNSGDDFSPVTDGTERIAQCIDPNIAQVALTNVHRLDLVIPDYYVDRYPYTHQVQYRMYYRQYGCDYGPLHNPDTDNCPNLGRNLIYTSPKFSIADELGPTVKVNDMPATQYKGGEVLPITWTNKDGIWDPIGKSCDGGTWDTNPLVKAWFSTDRFDNVATTSYDIQLWKGGALFATIANGLAGNQTSFYWDIPVDYAEGNYQIRVIGHDTTPAGGNSSYYADTVLPYDRDIQTDFFNSTPSGTFAIVAPACPTVTINTPAANDDFNPGDEVNVTWTVTLPDAGSFTNWVTVTGPCGYDQTFNLANSYFNWAIPFDACVGNYTITVHAQNGCPTEATATVVVKVNDIVAPVITNLSAPASKNQGETANIVVTATDNVAVTQYLISITGPANYNYSDTNATGTFNWAIPATAKPGYYTVTALAKDAAGNISDPATKVIEVMDVTNPAISLTAPAEGLVVKPNDVVNVTWSASDDSGSVSYVQVRIQGQLETVYDQTFDSVTTSFNWTVPGNAKPGNFTIQATAYDAAGNHTASNVRTIVVSDVVAPVINNFKANGTCPANADLGSVVSFTFDATDNVAVVSKTIKVAGPGYAFTLAGLSWNIPAGAEPGNYIATGTACDAAGNCTDATCIVVVKDGTAPVVSGFTATPGTIVPGGSVKFDWTATDNRAVVAQTLRITGPGGWDNTINVTAAARTYSVSFPKIAALGAYTATLTACDAEPNCTPATTTFTLADTVAPVVAVTAPAANLLVNANSPLNITWTATDNVDVASQWIVITGPGYNQTFNSTVSAYNWTTPAAAGDYVIKAYAKDNAGLTGESATVTVRVRVFPAITVAHKLTDPFRIQLFGTNFQQGCVVTINGTPAEYTFKNGGKLLLKNVGSLCPKGVEVKIQVVNPDGGYSNLFSFTK